MTSSEQQAMDVALMRRALELATRGPAADAAMLAAEMPNAQFVRARSILEWRSAPERLNTLAAGFARSCWDSPRGARRRTP